MIFVDKNNKTLQVGSKVRYGKNSEVYDEGYPDLDGLEGKVVAFGLRYVYVVFDKLPDHWSHEESDKDGFPCEGVELEVVE